MMLDRPRSAADHVLSDPGDGRYVLHVHRSAEVWTWASAVAIAAEIRRDLLSRPRARLLLTADESAAPVYRALSRAPLEWSRVDVALSDERWLQPDDPDSHAWRVRSELVRHHASQLRFEPLTQAGRGIEEAIAIANAHGTQPLGAAVLGMGSDGHVASLFPLMFDLPRALASRAPYAAVDASGCPAAREWTRRITVTPAGLARSRSRLLLIRGHERREAFEYALASGKVESWPVLAALQGDTPLQVHWCA